MASLRRSPRTSATQGFTLIETLMVLSLLTILAGTGLYLGTDSLARASARTVRATIISALERARHESLAGTASDPAALEPPAHGVYISDSSLTIFEGSSYLSRVTAADETIPFSSGLHLGGDREFVFRGGTADAIPATLILSDDTGLLEHIAVNRAGGILTLP